MGVGAAALITTGVVHPTSLTHFVGYVRWRAWLLALTVWLF